VLCPTKVCSYTHSGTLGWKSCFLARILFANRDMVCAMEFRQLAKVRPVSALPQTPSSRVTKSVAEALEQVVTVFPTMYWLTRAHSFFSWGDTVTAKRNDVGFEVSARATS
jgi:hypothetical protein